MYVTLFPPTTSVLNTFRSDTYVASYVPDAGRNSCRSSRSICFRPIVNTGAMSPSFSKPRSTIFHEYPPRDTLVLTFKTGSDGEAA